MKQDNFKAPPEPPIEKDDNNVYNFKCEKCDTKYRFVVILRILLYFPDGAMELLHGEAPTVVDPRQMVGEVASDQVSTDTIHT